MASLSPTGTRTRSLGAALLIAVLALLPHMPASYARYTYDDYEFVRGNASITSLGRALSAWVRPFPPEQPARGLYRPLTALSYAADAAVFGMHPRSFHISNLLLYVTCSELVLLVAWQLFGSMPFALLAASVFALHPVHCEVVDSISGRSELLALLLSLLALAQFQPRRSRRFGTACALAAYSAALFAKETSVMTLAVLATVVALEQRWRPGPVVRAWARLWPFALATGGYLALRVTALEGHLTPASTYVGGADLETRVFTSGRVFAEYARLLVAPLHLEIDAYYERTIGVQHHASLKAVGGLILISAVLVLLARLGRRLSLGGDHDDRLPIAASLGLSCLVFYLFPVSHVVPFGALMAERFLFGPSFGFAILCAGAGQMLSMRLRSRALRSAMLAGLTAALLGSALRTYQRARDWYDDVTLFSATAALLPDDYRLQTNVARGYLERSDIEHAVPWLEASLRLRPHDPAALNNLAYAYLQLGQLTQAEQILRRLLAIAPQHAIAWYNLGAIAKERGELNVARDAYRRALERNPNYALAERDLAEVEHQLTEPSATQPRR